MQPSNRRSILRGTGEYELKYRICRHDQHLRWVQAKGKCFFQDFGDGREAVRFVGMIIDRTDQKLTHHALLQAKQVAHDRKAGGLHRS